MARSKIASKVFALLAFAAAGIACYWLFFVPAFREYRGIIISYYPLPELETAWQHFAFWPPLPSTPADPWVFVVFTMPVVVTLAAAVALWSKRGVVRMVLLWEFWGILLLPTAYLIAEYVQPPLVFLPATFLLFVTVILETISYLRKRGSTLLQVGLETTTH